MSPNSTPTKKAAASPAKKDEQPTGAANPSANPASDGDDSTTSDTSGDTESKKVETEEVDTDFVVAQTLDPNRSIPGTSQYLDEVERRSAELIRAKAEDREPDLDNPPASQGTPLYTTAQAKQQGLDVTGEAVQTITLGVTKVKGEAEQEAFVNYDANNGAGASVLVNSGVPVK